MTPRTWTIIGLTVVALGVGVYALGLFSEEARVRQVAQVLADPHAHTDGDWTVVGLPQPEMIPVSGDGAVRMVRNDAYTNETRHVRLLEDGMQQVDILRLERSDGERHHFVHTRQLVRPGEAVEETSARFSVVGMVFVIEGFDVGGSGAADIWAVYGGTLAEPLQPKPSQFTGRLATSVPDGPLPDGAYLLTVDQVTVGCSSKFLPPEHQDEQA